MARKVGFRHTIYQTQATVDLADADGDVALTLRVPADGCRVRAFWLQTTTAGTGTQNHKVTLEQGATTSGVALTGQILLLADAAAETLSTVGVGLEAPPEAVRGSVLQLQNVEAGAISNGAIANVHIIWEL